MKPGVVAIYIHSNMSAPNIEDLEPAICERCARDPELRAFIADRGTTQPLCFVCLKAGARACFVEGDLVQLLKALVRFHYSEHQYNGHYGGEPFERLLAMENPILAPVSDEAGDAIAYSAFSKGYEDPDSGVSLFAGDGVLSALKSEFSPSLRAIKESLLKANHYEVEPRCLSLLERISDKVARVIEPGTQFMRARIGFVKTYYADAGWELSEGYVPYSGLDIGAPPPNVAQAGRLNRPGVSHLYLASDLRTAVAEVRPHPGHVVSLGAFRTVRALRVASVRDYRLRDFATSDNALSAFRLIHSLGRDLSTPVTPDERHRYLLGQVVADSLRKLGFDGVEYRSSVAEGYNLCVFAPSSCEYVKDGACAVRVGSLKYEHVNLASALTVPTDAFEIP